MLLLVLVLVLIAFGLLVVALLSGTALWAWVSVAVSVVAAIVLLIDWLQRRAAVRSADRQQAAQAPPPEWTSFDADPVTEQIPVIRADAVAPPEQVPEHVSAAETLVVGPAAEPPVAPQAPSGAQPWLPQSRDLESQRVTDFGVNPSAESPPVPGQPAPADPTAVGGRDNGKTPAEPRTVVQPMQPAPAADPEQTTEVKPVVAAAAPSSPDKSAPGPADATSDKGETKSEVKSTAGQRVVTGNVTPAAATTAPAAQPDKAASATADGGAQPAAEPEVAEGVDAEPATSAIVQPAAAVAAAAATAAAAMAAEPAAEPAKTADQSAKAAEAAPVDSAATTKVQAVDKPADEAGGAVAAAAAPPPENKTSIFEKPDTTNEQTVVLPVSAETEPPEEPHDSSNAAVVAELVDVVVVIDERPRYHVSGCRYLPGKTEIPLPVKEAVELGFTPCGWCNPDRTLSTKHRATSSH